MVPDPLLAALLLAGAVALLIGLVLVPVLRTGVPPMPSSRAEKAALMTLLPRQHDGLIVDLGVGWGGLLADALRRCPEARGLGVDISPLPLMVARLRFARQPRARLMRVEAGRFLVRNPFTGQGPVVLLLFLGPAMMTRLAPDLRAALPPGSLVLCNAFALPGWTPETRLELGDGLTTRRIYRYRVPGNASA
ncbi:hypothetical protein [Yunchengibacter salinarum]|uniref:hypothetical protein n=1 Tax=Yunchengibacter salinarum TaxID=3133399 RepID=UPI0035B5EA33